MAASDEVRGLQAFWDLPADVPAGARENWQLTDRFVRSIVPEEAMRRFEEAVQNVVSAEMDRRDRMATAALLLTEPGYRHLVYETDDGPFLDADFGSRWAMACIWPKGQRAELLAEYELTYGEITDEEIAAIWAQAE